MTDRPLGKIAKAGNRFVGRSYDAGAISYQIPVERRQPLNRW